MASYRIEKTILTRQTSGKSVKTTGSSGLVTTRSELKEFIEDYKRYVHDCPMALLSKDLSKEFSDWLVGHEARQKRGAKEAISVLLGFFSPFVTGHAGSIGGSAIKTIGMMASDMRYEKQEHEFVILTFHFRCLYACGRLGVFLHETPEGEPYETIWGMRGRAWTLARLKGERFVGG